MIWYFKLPICLLLILQFSLNIQAQCVTHAWAPGDPLQRLVEFPSAGHHKLATNASIHLNAVFLDRDRITADCLPTPHGERYNLSSPTSVYSATFQINNADYASFDPIASQPLISVGTTVKFRTEREAPVTFPGSPIPYINLGSDYRQTEDVVLRVLPMWMPNAAGVLPPPIIVTVTITDITPAVPAGDTGNCTDPVAARIQFTWTFDFNTLCPNGLLREVGTSPDNIWINVLGNHDAQTCTPGGPNPAIDVVPFCYRALPDLGPIGPPDYTGSLITEVFGPQMPDFSLDDINPTFFLLNPGLMSAEQIARSVFTHHRAATFELDALDRMEDSHGKHKALEIPKVEEIFTQPAIEHNNIGYNFTQDYQCNGVSILNATIFRRLQAIPTPAIPKPPSILQIRKQH